MSPYKVPEASQLTEGLQVQWIYTQPGGYGFKQAVPATVAKVTPKRVRIDALKQDGSTVRRTVKRESLRVATFGGEA